MFAYPLLQQLIHEIPYKQKTRSHKEQLGQGGCLLCQKSIVRAGKTGEEFPISCHPIVSHLIPLDLNITTSDTIIGHGLPMCVILCPPQVAFLRHSTDAMDVCLDEGGASQWFTVVPMPS